MKMELDWQKVVTGLRKKLNLSLTQLGKEINLGRQTLCRYESKQRIPNENSSLKLALFIQRKRLDSRELEKIGELFKDEYKERVKINKLNLMNSIELAELIGIILGDGEVMRDGTIRISFDPKKDKNYINRRVFFLITYLLGNKIGYESNKRISFGNMAFVRYLSSINMKPGSKVINNLEIPDWCFSKRVYLAAVLRGLFDTDGYFGYCNGPLEIMLGRFSCRGTGIVKSISEGLTILRINHKVRTCKDGQYKIVISKKSYVLLFFHLIGTSNLKHIVRFILWRTIKYEAKIELEGLKKLMEILKLMGYHYMSKIDLPFTWILENQEFREYIKPDLEELKGSQIRKFYKWNEIIKKLVKLYGITLLAKKFDITKRSVRKWKQGTRTPSDKYVLELLRLLKVKNIQINEYKRIDKMAKQTVDALIEGGKATAAPPLGPAL